MMSKWAGHLFGGVTDAIVYYHPNEFAMSIQVHIASRLICLGFFCGCAMFRTILLTMYSTLGYVHSVKWHCVICGWGYWSALMSSYFQRCVKLFIHPPPHSSFRHSSHIMHCEFSAMIRCMMDECILGDMHTHDNAHLYTYFAWCMNAATSKCHDFIYIMMIILETDTSSLSPPNVLLKHSTGRWTQPFYWHIWNLGFMHSCVAMYLINIAELPQVQIVVIGSFCGICMIGGVMLYYDFICLQKCSLHMLDFRPAKPVHCILLPPQ